MIVIKALVLVDSPSSTEAMQAVFSALNSAAFESANPVVDFALGFEQTAHIADPASYRDGDFVCQVPGAQLLATANNISLPI